MKTITTTLLTALLLTAIQSSSAADPFNRTVFNPPSINIPRINPNHLAQLNKPDLIVESLYVIGRPRVLANNSIQVPISLAINNIGTKSAGRFKISVDFIRSGRAFVVPFKAQGFNSRWYPMTRVAIRAGGNRHISGMLTFRSSERGKTFYIRAKVDSCSGEEFTRSYCRIDERNENNNLSRLVRVRLP